MKTINQFTMYMVIVTVSISLTGCISQSNTQISVEDIDQKANILREAIRNSTSEINAEGQSYYVSNNGDDSQDGHSPQTAIKSIEKVNTLDLKPGDAVLFKRGDLWRGAIQTREGVSYAAYGEGAKPTLYGSPYDATQEGVWKPTDIKDVYVYDKELTKDVGTLVFNHGDSCAFKVMKRILDDKSTVHVETGELFRDYRDLKRDLDFYHDYKETHRIYLCSKKGNPAQRFHSIELLIRTNIFYVVNNVTIDNLCLKYCGAHAIGSGTVKNLLVTNCEIGWIGGSIQGENLFSTTLPTRFGNGIEIYGGCENYTVDSCYVYQVYDAAITHQYQKGGTNPIIMKNVTYTNNLVEDCVYSIEYFAGKAANDTTRYMEHILIENNVMLRAGMGWGKQRPDKQTPAHIKSWEHHQNQASDFIIRGNIFERSTHDLLNIVATNSEWLPQMQNNIFIQYRNASGGTMGYFEQGKNPYSPEWEKMKKEDMRYSFNENYSKVLEHLFGETKAQIILLE